MVGRQRRIVWTENAYRTLQDNVSYIPSIREIFVDRYRLVCKVTEAEVVLLAFIHGSRDLLKRDKSEE